MIVRLHVVALVAALFAAPPAPAQQASLPSDVPRPGPEVLYWPLAQAPQLENAGSWQAEPILVSGASAYRSGEFLYQDYLYDDRGAAAPGVTGGTAGTAGTIAGLLGQGAGGTYSYPLDPVYARNAADLVEIRLKLLADATAVRITYNALLDPERVATTLAFGTSPAPRPIPHGANASMPAAVFVTAHGASGDIVDAATGLPLAGVSPTVTVDTERRQVEVVVPHAAFDPRGQTAVRIAAATGLWDTGSAATPSRTTPPRSPRTDLPMPRARAGAACSRARRPSSTSRSATPSRSTRTCGARSSRPAPWHPAI